MSGFLSRWVRLKSRVNREEETTPVDLASLPPIETLTGASDITGFMSAAVPQALQSQALRIAWESDARIASFRGLADYDWDFNAVDYGRLALADDVAALVQRVVAPITNLPAPEQFPEPPAIPRQSDPVALPPVAMVGAPTQEAASSDQPTDSQAHEPTLSVRRHGGALPI
jgi:hypothetical protein